MKYKKTFYLAQYESANFLFEGTGWSEQQARVVLNMTLQLHCKQRGCKLADFFYADEVYVRKIQPGFGFIDKDHALSVRVKCL